jgi:uncharacterized membrane protein
MNNEFKYGLVAGCGFVIWYLILFLTNVHNERPDLFNTTDLIGQAIIILSIFAGLYFRKMNMPDYELPFGQGVRAGMMISFISSIIISAFLYFYVNYINVGYNAAQIAFIKQQMLGAKLKPDVFKQQMQLVEQMFNGSATSVFSILVRLTSIGVVVSALVSFVLRFVPTPKQTV